MRAGKPERLEGLCELGGDASWPAAADGRDFRLPIRVQNFSHTARGTGLISVDLTAATARWSRTMDLSAARVTDGGQPVPSYCLGKALLFEGRVEPMCRKTFYIYFRRATAPAKTAQPGVQQYAANPAMPGGELPTAAASVTPADYARLLRSPWNCVRNADFAAGDPLPEKWLGAVKPRPGGVEMACSAPGLFGKRCVRTTVPASIKADWVGWRQDVPVTPGKSYLLAGWLKCQALDGSLQIHAHYRNARGELCRTRQMTGAGPTISGTADWSLASGLFAMPDDAATFQLHLTMNCHGTAWHDGLLLVEVIDGRLGGLESRHRRGIDAGGGLAGQRNHQGVSRRRATGAAGRGPHHGGPRRRRAAASGGAQSAGLPWGACDGRAARGARRPAVGRRDGRRGRLRADRSCDELLQHDGAGLASHVAAAAGAQRRLGRLVARSDPAPRHVRPAGPRDAAGMDHGPRSQRRPGG